MTGRTAWTSGNGQGYTWGTLFNGSDLVSMPSGDAVLSTVTAIANQTNQDIYMDVSIEMTIGSATPSAGASVSLYAYYLLGDGTTYGDGQLVAGTQKAYVPQGNQLVGVLPIETSAAVTLMCGMLNGVVIYPGTVLFALYNGTGVTLSATAGNCVVKYRTYNLNLNN